MASKFYLMNEKRVRWGLNRPESGVFTDPKGFGSEYSSSYLKVGDIWVTDSRELSQPQPSGTILFTKRMYETFQALIRFINQARQLVFVYQPAGIQTEYFANVDLISIEKGSYHRGQRMEVPIKLVCKSLFYTEEALKYRIQRSDKELRWDFKWETRFNDLNYVSFSFQNDGHAESPFQLSFTGYCTNPVVTVYQDNRLLHEVPFFLTLQAKETLTFSTFDDALYVEVNGTDRKECLDFTRQNFFKLPIGASEVYFRCQTGKMNHIILSLEKYYKAV